MRPEPIYLLDTNVCIYIRRERPQSVLERFKELPPGSTAISVVTYGEIVYGICKSSEPHKGMRVLEALTILIPVLPMATGVAQTYGTIRADLALRGQLIGNNDLWIAAHAKNLGLTVVTNNESEFRRVDGLAVENWVA
jgi:tRNA(fMet)-specific endonuclease VapC